MKSSLCGSRTLLYCISLNQNSRTATFGSLSSLSLGSGSPRFSALKAARLHQKLFGIPRSFSHTLQSISLTERDSRWAPGELAVLTMARAAADAVHP